MLSRGRQHPCLAFFRQPQSLFMCVLYTAKLVGCGSSANIPGTWSDTATLASHLASKAFDLYPAPPADTLHPQAAGGSQHGSSCGS